MTPAQEYSPKETRRGGGDWRKISSQIFSTTPVPLEHVDFNDHDWTKAVISEPTPSMIATYKNQHQPIPVKPETHVATRFRTLQLMLPERYGIFP